MLRGLLSGSPLSGLGKARGLRSKMAVFFGGRHMITVFLRTFLMIFLAEMGDKSQFLLAALTAEYRLRDILAGSGVAIAVLCGLAVSVGSVVGGLLPMTLISLVAGGAFLFFAWSGLGGEGSADEKIRRGKAFPAIFGTYFLAELGDKTQLATLTLAAANPGTGAAVFLGAAAALFFSGLLGVALGLLLGKHLPAGVFRLISTVIFAACGAVRLLGGLERLLPVGGAIAVTVGILMIFILLCAVRVRWKGGEHDTAGNKPVSV